MLNQTSNHASDQTAALLSEILILPSQVLVSDRFNAVNAAADAPCGTKCGAGCGGGCGTSA